MRKTPLRLVIIALVASTIVFLAISASGCPKRNGKIKTGSSINTFSINAPSGLIATVVSYDRVNLAWIDNATNNDGFELQRSLTINNNFATIATTGNVNSYLDTGLAAFNTYYYRVRASNTIGDRSSWSNEVLVTTTPIWTRISVGQSHSHAIANDGTVWGWGQNNAAQLGIGTIINKNMPTRIITDFNFAPFTGISSIVAGDDFVVASKNDNTLWVWGSNNSGQYGVGDVLSVDWPLRMGITSDGFDLLTDWVDYTIGNSHAIIRKSDNTLYGCGNNEYGQLGVGDGLNRWTPTQIGTQSDWSSVSAGWMHTLAIKNNNTLYAWGFNNYKQLGLGAFSAMTVTIPTLVVSDTNWIQVSAGGNFSVARKSNDTLYSFGGNGYGQLGDGTTTDRLTPRAIGTDSDWTDIATGWWHALARKTDNTIYSWGFNRMTAGVLPSGQLGLGDSIDRNTPTQIGTDSDWVELDAGQYHSLGRKTNNSIYAWGSNLGGELGLNDNIIRSFPHPVGFYVRAPTSFNSNVISDTQVTLSWIDMSYNEEGFKIERCYGTPVYGSNWYIEIATVGPNITLYSDATITPGNFYYYRIAAYSMYGSSTYSASVLVTTIPTGNWSDNFCAGNYHSLAIKTNGTLWAWGLNDMGQLGLGDTNFNRYTPAQIGLDSDWSRVAANGDRRDNGQSQSFAIKTNPSGGTLWAWGNNDYGQLGVGDFTKRITPAQINSQTDWSNVIAGIEHTLAIKTNLTLWSCGYNNYGQLGLGDSTDGTERNTLTQIGIESNWFSASAGYMHSMAIKNNSPPAGEAGTLWSWGYNAVGQLGLGNSGSANSKNIPTQVGVSTDWLSVCASYNFTIAAKMNGTIWSWGTNTSGQLGLGITSGSVKRLTPSQIGFDADWDTISAAYQLGIASKTDGTVWGWGNSLNGQLTQYIPAGYSSSPIQIGINTPNGILSSGGALDNFPLPACHCFIINNGNLWGWGYTEYGQLGLGTTVTQMTPKIIVE